MIGKNDRGEVVGVANAAKLLEDIPNQVRDILGIMVEVNLHTERGKDWLEIVVEPYPSPISYKGEYHYRSGSTKEFRLAPGGLWVVFPFPPSHVMGTLQKQVTGQVTGQVESWVMRVIRACAVGALSSLELQALVGIKHRETFQRNYLDLLLSEQWLERTIPEKPKSRLQKYRLTKKGETFLKNPQ